MNTQQVVIIHGGEAFATYEAYIADLERTELDLARANAKGWKDTIAEALGEGYDVIRPRMPNAANAKYREWKIWFDKYVPHLKDGVICVGHSLGGIFFAKYFAEHTLPVRVGALVLVAAPYNDEDAPYSLADFALPASLSGIYASTHQVILMQSEDDQIVPFLDVLKYKKALPEAEVVTFTNAGHFIGEAFPELVQKINLLHGNREEGT